MKRIPVLGMLLALVLTSIGMPVSAKNYSDWSAPVNLGPVVNGAFQESCPSLTKDGLSLYFVSTRTGDFDLYVSQRSSVDDAWGAPQNLGSPVNTTAIERCPYVTPDGHYLIFVSTRGGEVDGGDFYMSYRHDKKDNFAWEAPVNITTINALYSTVWAMSGFEEEDTGLLRLYFAAIKGTADIYSTTMTENGVFSTPVLVSELSSPATEQFATVSKDGLEVFVVSNRTGGVGSFDLWVATRKSTSDPWSTPVNVDKDVLNPVVNSPAGESRAALSWDGSTIIFVSARPGIYGASDLLQTTRTKVTGSGK